MKSFWKITKLKVYVHPGSFDDLFIISENSKSEESETEHCIKPAKIDPKDCAFD